MLGELLASVSFELAKKWKVDQCERALLINPEGRVIYAKIEENIGKYILEIVDPRYEKTVLHHFKKVVDEKETVSFKTKNYTVTMMRCEDCVLTTAQRKKNRVHIEQSLPSFVCALSLILNDNITNTGIV